jgi:hypothetical protein
MMRPNAIGWGIVAFFFLAGVGFMIPEETRAIWIGQIWVVVSLVLAAVYLLMIRRANKADRLRHVGTPGKAIIEGMTQTGTYVNEQPVVKLDLEVQPDGLPAYSLKKKGIVPLMALGQLGVGNALPIHVDPNDRENIVIDWGASAIPGTAAAAPGRPGGDPSQRLEQLERLRKSGEITAAEYDQQRQRILSEI